MSQSNPPAPPGWTKTLEDLFAECHRGERPAVGSPEVDWARDYESSLIPADVRFPRKGDIYQALADVPVRYLTAWAAPHTGGGQGTLKAGERILVDQELVEPRPITVYARPLNYAVVEARLISEVQRKDAEYDGYYLSLKTMDLCRLFRLVADAGG